MPDRHMLNRYIKYAAWWYLATSNLITSVVDRGNASAVDRCKSSEALSNAYVYDDVTYVYDDVTYEASNASVVDRCNAIYFFI